MYLSQKLMLDTPGSRHGIVLEPQRAPLSQSDVGTIMHMGVPASVASPWQSAAGGVARDEGVAKRAAIGEAIERSVAMLSNIPSHLSDEIVRGTGVPTDSFCFFNKDQRVCEDFPFHSAYDDTCQYTEVFDIQTNKTRYVPHGAVLLNDSQHTGLSTSSGLAAGATQKQALLRGVQELIERDALMTTWLHGLPGRRVESLELHDSEVADHKGEMYTFDITPAYSPFPVAVIAGGIKKRGVWRYSLGVACRESWHAAVEKAYLEWNQGVLFAGVYGEYVDTTSIVDPYSLETFDEHAIFYSLHPEMWYTLAFFTEKDTIREMKQYKNFISVEDALSSVRRALKKHSIRMYYRDITTVDAMQVGISVVKAVSPDMAQIFAHQRWPFLNRVDDLLKRNYPDMVAMSQFPYLMPHPLG